MRLPLDGLIRCALISTILARPDLITLVIDCVNLYRYEYFQTSQLTSRAHLFEEKAHNDEGNEGAACQTSNAL